MDNFMHYFSYTGEVYIFDTLQNRKWTAKTRTTSMAKARSNLMHQYRKQHNLPAYTPVRLPANIRMI